MTAISSSRSQGSRYRVRPFSPSDKPRLSLICCKTGNTGDDGTGMLLDDEIWGEIWVLPYAERHPDLTFVVENVESKEAVGYACATDDSDAFYTWYGKEWWPSPSHGARFYRPSGAELEERSDIAARTWETLHFEDTKGPKPIPPEFDLTSAYPAHAHINLLPECRGAGFGRELLEAICEALRKKGAKGVHLLAGDKNEDAARFYVKVGYTEMPAEEGLRCFTKKL